MKTSIFLILSIALATSTALANVSESCDARAALSETMMEARMMAADREISQPLFLAPEPKKKIEAPVVIQLSESEVESNEEDFVLDEE